MKHILGTNSRSLLSEVEPGDVQPNAVDLRLDKVFEIHPDVFTISETNKIHRKTSLVEPDQFGWYQLLPGHFEVIMKNKITVGENEAGWVITRSTLNRNGVFLTSGLYDSGYSGVMAAVMHVSVGAIRIQRGTRIGQYLSFEAEMLKKYEGSYGSGSDHDKKYEAK